ncbi:MAG TPA: acetate/propionate family kinase [Stellaceae bacterium]|nr:acetate/propionate family kinase [Stellaceae bacterium]
MTDRILTVNAGSSSVKFAVFEARDVSTPVLKGQIDGIGAAPRLSVVDRDGKSIADKSWSKDAGHGPDDFLDELLKWVEEHPADIVVAAGHRVVHGGGTFTAPVRIDEAVLRALERLTPLAPLHQPRNLAPIHALRRLRSDLPQVASFDTAFHRTMPDVATRLALPRSLTDQGIRRYGFHGLSYEYIAGTLARYDPALAAGRVVVAHLGNGASLCALKAGKSVDTTMSFTTLDGLVMGTRSGALDPGVLLYLLQAKGLSPADLEDLLYHRSGLLGVSGISGDMRALEKSDDPAAEEAIELFVFHAAREIAAMAASLGGLDGIVFTAGIGEHSPEIRRRISDRAAWLGVRFDQTANATGGPRLSTADSPVSVWVIPTNEEAMLARHTLDVLSADIPSTGY